MLLHRFLDDRRANVAMIFGLAVIPIIGFVGAAVDYSRAGAVRTEMQSALDATALMLAKEAPTLTESQLAQRAADYFAATFTRPEAKDLTVTPTYSVSDGKFHVKVSASAKIDATIARVLGHSQLAIGSSSEVVWGIKKLELALALDNTGSMAWSNKMTELKKAAKNLLDTLKTSAKKDGDIKVAIIPFATDVNVGKGNVNATWLDWSEWQKKNGKCKNYESGWGWGWDEPETKSSCTARQGTWTASNHSAWNGCVMDRDQDNDVKDTAPVAGVKSTLFPTNEADNCPIEMQPLTSNWGKLVSTVESMKPQGNTNVTIGLTWAWHALTLGSPLTEAAAPAPDLEKVIVLLTDGDNTENRWSKKQSEIDARTKKACDNVKAAGIKVYAIRVIEGNVSLLKDCATSPSMYFDVQNAGQLSGVFSTISKSLANLRLSK